MAMLDTERQCEGRYRLSLPRASPSKNKSERNRTLIAERV